MPSNPGRLQVPDLAAPEALRPGPQQADTFAAPAQAPIDHDLEQLSSALGTFHSGVASYIHSGLAAQKKALETQHLAQLETFRQSAGNQAVVDAVNAGKLPFQDDPMSVAWGNKVAASILADNLGQQVQSDVNSGKLTLGVDGFNPELEMRTRAQPLFDRAANNPGLTVQLGAHIDTLSKALIDQNNNARGALATEASQKAAFMLFQNGISNGVENGLSGQQIMDQLRPQWKDLGARPGGSLGLKPNQLDDVLFTNLEQAAKNPRTAAVVGQMVDATRSDLQTGGDIGPISQNPRFNERAFNLKSTALNTLTTSQTAAAKDALGDIAAQSFLKGDGSFNKISAFSAPSSYDASKNVDMTVKQQQDAGAQKAFAIMRANNGGQVDTGAELSLAIKNNFPHAEVISELKGAYGSTPTSGAISPQAIQRLSQAADKFDMMADRGNTYAQEQLGDKPYKFYSAFSMARRDLGMDSAQAAAAVIHMQGVEDAKTDIQKATEEKAVADAANTKYPNWIGRNVFGGAIGGPTSAFGPLGNTVPNEAAVQQRVKDMASLYSKITGEDAATSVQYAADKLSSQIVTINGQGVMGPGLEQGDDKYVQPLFDKIFNENKDRLAEQGITSANQLSIKNNRNGVYNVVKWNGGPVSVWNTDPNTGAVSTQAIYLQSADIQAEKSAQQAASQKSAVNAFDAKTQASNNDEALGSPRDNFHNSGL